MKITYKWFASYFDTALFTCSVTISNNLQQSKMAKCSKEQKHAVGKSRLFQRCFLNFEKSSFLMKTMLLRESINLVLHAKNTTEIQEESVESGQWIDAIITCYRWKMLFCLWLCQCFLALQSHFVSQGASGVLSKNILLLCMCTYTL